MAGSSDEIEFLAGCRSAACAYPMQHDAHRCRQICVLARPLGHELSGDDTMPLWGWKAISLRSRRRGVPRRAAKLARTHS